MPLLPLEAYRGNGKASGGNSAKELGNVNNPLCLYLAIIGPQRALLGPSFRILKDITKKQIDD